MFAHRAGNFQSPLSVFNTARAGNHNDTVPAYCDVSDFDYGVGGMQFAAHQLERLGYGNGLFDARQRFIKCGLPVLRADDSQNRLSHLADFLHHMALGTKHLFEPVSFLLSYRFFQNENHGSPPVSS